MPTTDQPSLLARIRALSERILEYRQRFSLPRGHKDRYDTHGAALGLQKLKQERSVLQGQLEPFKVIATGISCRDCAFFRDYPNKHYRYYCGFSEHDPIVGLVDTGTCRQLSNLCGPSARSFQPIAAHA